MFINRYKICKQLSFLLLTCSFLSLLAACGSTSASSTQAASVHGAVSTDGLDSTTAIANTVAMPTTQTSCPAPGTGRAAVMAPLATHGRQTLVYVVNERSAGTLKRLDVATGQKTEIVKLLATNILHAQLSTDGQWVLFVAYTSNVSKLQLIRMDGQGLQTLYCATGNTSFGNDSIVWSNNQHSIVFSFYGPQGNISLLNIQTGKVQVALTTPMRIVTMLDNTRVYVELPATDAPPSTLALLDTSKGPNQHIKDLRPVFVQSVESPSAYPCWDADSSYDATRLFISQCVATASTTGPGIGAYEGPSTIELHGVTGDAPFRIFKNAQLAITGVRAVTSKILLLQTTNGSPVASKNDLWAVRTDGTGLVHLAGSNAMLNGYVQTPWANVSRDGTRYAFQTLTSDGQTNTYTLGYGSLNGGTPTIFASISETELRIAGWTTL
ncbi:MAG: hypothetical protein NVSMB49_17390 [Ktedonobacteraceae bacterium]